jgi:adenosylcobinamide-phosphate synthase
VRLEYQIITAMALDGLVGDPRWLPHPVKLIGALAARLERLSRRLVPWEYAAGGVTAAIVVSAAGAAAWLIVAAAAALHPLAGDAASILLLYTTFAARDLAGHGAEVFRELQAGNLPQARRKVAMMVGRDTESLDEEGIARAAVESVAENTVDGVTAPLLYAIAGGPVAAMMYKAVNTLDSTFGYKTERYLRFGWASAKLDDFANYLPARITALFMVVAAALLRMRAGRAWGTLIRDGRKHTSPNSGLCEAAMAGALGVRLGGRNYYFGKPSDKPYIGNPGAPPRQDDIRRGNRLMLATYTVTAAVFLCARMAITGGIG